MGNCLSENYNNCFGAELFRDDDGGEYCILHAPLQIRKKYDLNARFAEVLAK